MLQELINALEETLFMVFTAGLLTWIIGLPLGALLSVTGKDEFLENPLIHKPLRALINVTERVPYIVFMIATIPLTRIIIGSGEGSVAAVVPLTLASIPYFAKFSENAINQVPKGLIEAARAVGASSFQIVYKVLIPEALPNIISGLTTILTHLVGYSTVAGVLGAGGLGSLIIHKGYLTFQIDYVVAIVLTLILLIQIIQSCGNYIASGSLHKNSSA